MSQNQDDTTVSEVRTLPRVPPAVYDIQVNRCKNPVCENFGLPVAEGSTRGRYADNDYTIVASGAKQLAAKCNSCGDIFGLKSNQGVFEETYRILASVYGVSACPDKDCANHRVPTSVAGAYQEFGKTVAGSQRYRCKACEKTFSVKSRTRNPIAKQVHSDKNRTILSLLVNKMPLRRICEAADIAPKVLYDRIDFFHERACAFLSEREKAFPGLDVRRLYVGVDRQDHVVNWSQREDKRNVTISSVACADNPTGYVFGMVPNFDPEPDPAEVEALHAALGDVGIPACHRRHARLWLKSDFDAALAASRKFRGKGTLNSEIEATYATATARQDIEAPEHVAVEDALPDSGMLVHAEYTLYGFSLWRCGDCSQESRRFVSSSIRTRACAPPAWRLSSTGSPTAAATSSTSASPRR